MFSDDAMLGSLCTKRDQTGCGSARKHCHPHTSSLLQRPQEPVLGKHPCFYHVLSSCHYLSFEVYEGNTLHLGSLHQPLACFFSILTQANFGAARQEFECQVLSRVSPSHPSLRSYTQCLPQCVCVLLFLKQQ